MPEGVTFIVCGRDRKPRCACSSCGSHRVLRACAYALRGARAGASCERLVCERCAVTTHTHSGGTVYCPAHARLVARAIGGVE